MTITHEPAHLPVHRLAHNTEQPRVDVYLPSHTIRVDQMFWQHRSIFAGTQQQLD